MLARIRKSAENKDSGFTLIELLVVMIIIGILAAIAIPAFLSQKKKAKEASAKSDVSTIGKEVAAYYVDGRGALALDGSTGTWTLKAGTDTVTTGKLSGQNEIPTGKAFFDMPSQGFCVTVKTSDGINWKYSNTGSLQSGECVAADAKA